MLNNIRGTSALVIEAVQGITNLVEALHAAIVFNKTNALTAPVYSAVRGVTRLVGWGINRGLDVAEIPAIAKAVDPIAARLEARLKLKSIAPHREIIRAAVNGVFGDTLAATENPLAITMQLRQQGKPLNASNRNGKLLILVHGLCMNDLQWLTADNEKNHDHGQMLSEQQGWEAIYLHYNSGRSIAENGSAFSLLLEKTLANWPVAVTHLAIVGHSMGGLVARSACHHAMTTQQGWIKHLGKVVTLGTPHAGAPLEKAGRGVDVILNLTPYTAPFAKLGLIRSAGIQDLRDGLVTHSGAAPVWPEHVKLFAVAGTKQRAKGPDGLRKIGQSLERLIGDGLVPVNSALGLKGKSKLGLPLPLTKSRQAIVYETNHFQMLGSLQVGAVLLDWLKR